MRVLIINTSERIGGAAIAANRLMEALKKNGVKARMLVRDKQTDHLTVASVGSNMMMSVKFVWERTIIFIANMFSRKNLFQVDIANTGINVTEHAEFKKADVIHLHWVNQGFLSLSDIDRIVHSGKTVVITLHDQWYFTGICHYSSECDKYKTLCENCGMLNSRLFGDLAKRVFNRKLRIYENSNITFVGCSKWMTNLAEKSRLTEDNKVVSIPNAINTERFHQIGKAEAREEMLLPLDKKLILFGCQRITDERKGFKYLVDALRIIKDRDVNFAENIEIVVVGGDSDKIRNSMPFKVIPVSYVSDPKKMVALYNAVDLYVTPSLQDNLPNTIVESLACGTPCVGFNVGGIPEMIDHKSNGYVAKYKDANDLATGILWTLTADSEKLSHNARTKAIETYSEDIVAKQYIRVYENNHHHGNI